MPYPIQNNNLFRWERIGLLCLALVLVGFGVLVEIRGAFLHKRRTDLAVYLRAAWAVRSGADFYSITDDKGLHYHYPPLLAILLSPFADPPPNVVMPGALPFAVSVGAWYLFSVCVALLSIHCLANALTDASPRLRALIGVSGSRPWWALRLFPLLSCLPYFGHALVLGQINVLWMAVMCWLAADLIRGRRLRAGLWLAVTICIKVVPVFLILYPVWRRDRRCLAGCVLGLAIGLVVIPAAILGPERAWTSARTWGNVMLLPAFGMGSDRSRDQELLGVWSTHNQALVPTLHKTIHLLDEPRPDEVSPTIRWTGWLLGAVLTGLTLRAGRSRPFQHPANEVLFLGALTVNMLLLSPGGHPHYMLLLVPLIIGLVAASWEAGGAVIDGKLRFIMVSTFLASVIPLIVQRGGICYDVGLPMYSALFLCLAAVTHLWRQKTVAIASDLSR